MKPVRGLLAVAAFWAAFWYIFLPPEHLEVLVYGIVGFLMVLVSIMVFVIAG